MPKSKKGHTKGKRETEFAHNPAYCMIVPDEKEGDGIVSTGQS